MQLKKNKGGVVGSTFTELKSGQESHPTSENRLYFSFQSCTDTLSRNFSDQRIANRPTERLVNAQFSERSLKIVQKKRN